MDVVVLRLDFASAQPTRIGAEYVDCTSRIGAEWGAEFAELPSIIRRGLVYTGGRPPLESTLVLWDDDVVRYSFLSFFALL